MDYTSMKLLTFIVFLHTRISFGYMPPGRHNGSDCSSQVAGMPCVAYRMEGTDCALLDAKPPDLFVGPWHVDGPSEVITEHFCKQDENANNMPGMKIRWKSPDHSGMRDLKGFEITIEGATEICIIVDLSHANITQDIFQYGELQFEQIIYPIEVGSLYIVTIHSLPKKITAKSRTHFSTSNSCKDASPATWIASLKIKKDFMNGTIFVTFDPPPLIYEFTSFTYQLKRQIGNNVSIETRRLNSTNCVFGNLTSTEKYQVTVQPYDPFWNDRIRCKCKNIAKVCDTCTWTRSGTFTFNNSIVRRNNVSELVNENITVKYDLKTDAIIISSVIPISVLIALIVFIVWKKGGFRMTPCFVSSEQGGLPLDLKRTSVIADKDSDTKKYICLVVNGERENYVCLLSSLQYLIQSTGRCITRVLDCSFSSVQMMVDVKNSDSIVLVTVPVYTKPVTNGVNYVETGQHFLESIQLAHEKSAKGKVFREKLVRITFYDIASGLNQYSCGRQFQLPNDLVPFLVDIGCLQTALTNDFELQRHMFMNTDFKMAFDDLIATCQTIISNNRVETTNTPSREQCECKLCIKDYQGNIELETSPLSCQHNKYSPKSDVVAGIYTQGIHRVGKDLSKNVTLSACHCKDRVQAFEDLKKTKSNDSPCNCPTHEIMLKSSLPLSYRNDTRVIRKKYDHDITAGDLGLPVASRKGELKQEHSAFPDGAVMETLLGQVKWDCENEEEDCVTNDITFPDSGYFECMSQVGAQFLGVSDINMVDIDDTEQDDVISRDMYLINRRYDYIIKQLNKGDAVSISGNSV